MVVYNIGVSMYIVADPINVYIYAYATYTYGYINIADFFYLLFQLEMRNS